MPDRHLDENGFVIDPDAGTPAHLTAHAIVDCGLCDDDGYRGGHVCDHVDRSETHVRGMARVRQVLAKDRLGGADTADTPKNRERGAVPQETASGGES